MKVNSKQVGALLQTCATLSVAGDNLDLGIDDAHRPCQGQPWMSKVVLRHMKHLGARIGNVKTLDVQASHGIADSHKTWQG